MKKIKIVRLFLSLCIIVITFVLIAQIDGMGSKYTTVSVRLKSDITKKTLCDAIEKEEDENQCKLRDITAFSQNEAIVEAKGLGRKVPIKEYCIYGNVEDVLPVSLIGGNLLIREDDMGCVLTKKSAFNLFGCVDVIGAEVKLNDKTYTVRGIVKANTEAIIYEAGKDTDTFNSLELKIGDENGEEYAKMFCNAYLLPFDYVIGGNYLTRILKNICVFPFLIVILDVMIGLIMKAKQHSCSKWLRYVVTVAGVGAIFIVFKKLGYFPQRWIPSKWSDFQHYSDVSKYIKSQLHMISFARPIAKEIALKGDLSKAMNLFILSMAGQFYLIRCINEWGSGVADKVFLNMIKIRQDIKTWRQNWKEKKQKVEELEEIDNEKSLD